MEEGQFDYRPATSLVPGRGPHSRDILTSPDDPSRFPSEREGIRWSDSEMLMGRFLIDIGELENWSGRLGHHNKLSHSLYQGELRTGPDLVGFRN